MIARVSSDSTSPAHLAATPLWRREPYRLLFPFGALLAWAGVLHWALYALGLIAQYHPIVHAIVQIEGFMMCFAVGFLFTAIPRRTGTAAPAAWQMGVSLAAPAGATIAAWFERWAISQLFWMLLVATLVVFVIARFRARDVARRPPHSFVWIPLSLGIGIIGSLLIAVYAVEGNSYFWLHDLGRLLVLQGMFLGLIVGVGGLAIPLITRGESPPDATDTRKDRALRWGHVTAAILLTATFWVENRISQAQGLLFRSVLVLVLLLASARIWRRPTLPGGHRWLVWLAAWMIPAGYLLAAVFPLRAKAGLHMVFIGGFALMAFSIGAHVALAHTGHKRLLSGRPWQVPVYGGLFLAATVLRGLVDFDPQRFFLWLGSSACVFLLATIAWASLVLPCLWRKPRSPAEPAGS
ncbi:MAG: NnrS family protein [Acidobacteriota bacterium]